LLGFNRENAEQVNLSQPIYEGIVQNAIQALSTSVQN
jgi:single-stranded-DNA-specific exonuclease